MKSLGMWKIPVMLLGLEAAVILAPACKSAEVSLDHFTGTGVDDVNQARQQKAAATARKQTPPTHRETNHDLQDCLGRSLKLRELGRRVP